MSKTLTLEVGVKQHTSTPCRASTILETHDLRMVYLMGKVEVPALRGVDLAIHPGEFVAIMGPSGCGKSTLLHIIGGLLTPTGGRVWIEGEELTRMSDSERTDLRRRKIGFVFQRFNLFPALTVEGNIVLAARIYANGRSELDRLRHDVLLRAVGLETKKGHRPAELSGGEQQRVALARAVVHRPAILLADEPTGNLDSENTDLVLKMIKEMNDRFRQTILMITHDPWLAGFADRIIHMKDGRIDE